MKIQFYSCLHIIYSIVQLLFELVVVLERGNVYGIEDFRDRLTLCLVLVEGGRAKKLLLGEPGSCRSCFSPTVLFSWIRQKQPSWFGQQLTKKQEGFFRRFILTCKIRPFIVRLQLLRHGGR